MHYVCIGRGQANVIVEVFVLRGAFLFRVVGIRCFCGRAAGPGANLSVFSVSSEQILWRFVDDLHMTMDNSKPPVLL